MGLSSIHKRTKRLVDNMSAVKYDYCGGVLIESIVEGVQPNGLSNTKRGVVRNFSSKSSSSMGRYLRGCVADYRYMLTLTYPKDCEDAVRAKSHLKSFLLRLTRHVQGKRVELSSAGINNINSQQPSFFWFLEFQRNGSPHFHIFTNYYFDYKLVAHSWYEVVGTGDARHLAAGTRTERLKLGRKGCISYAKKYAKKQEQKELPDMFKNSGFGRWWGVVGERRVVEATTVLQIGSGHLNKHLKLIDSIKLHIDFMVKAGKLKLMDYKLCKCWVTDDDETRNLLHSLIKECGEVKLDDNKVLQQTKKNASKNLYRERCG